MIFAFARALLIKVEIMGIRKVGIIFIVSLLSENVFFLISSHNTRAKQLMLYQHKTFFVMFGNIRNMKCPISTYPAKK